ncbi:N-acetylmuramoyl-L-alanine amidase [Streptomyces sp. NPDC007088]|uniref:N-acetylmuramoyl-L-alanine amidase n=1 Tax=Streptomyces sp. NPDC007088 TaxID=3364773 RepID=UPI00368343BE
MDHARPSLPGRRALLRGAALAAVPAALLSGGPAQAGESVSMDYPGSEWVPASASNYTVATRPSQYPVDYVVIHVTQEYYQDTLNIFKNPAKQVSAHYLVRSADGHIAQCVREKNVAWHAGNWDYNTRSIGIEHEGWVDQPKYFTDALYAASAKLTAAVCDTYGIPKDRTHILGHVEVPGTDHTDPGRLWDWTKYLRLVNLS